MECTKNRMFEVWIAFGDKLGHGQTVIILLILTGTRLSRN